VKIFIVKLQKVNTILFLSIMILKIIILSVDLSMVISFSQDTIKCFIFQIRKNIWIKTSCDFHIQFYWQRPDFFR